ncbi:P-loop containing nucleoside triphosphate hydrolase [Phytophthora cactorum]|nr:P-loop containing nucleoside triphosphate hydrolase [Phytophthora cactorum]
MSRHRNVRNRAYSYEDEGKPLTSLYYDEYYDDYEPSSPNNEFMYRRDSPSRQRSVFSFVQQEETEQEPTSDPGDAEILEAMVPQITQELRSANYDLDKTVVALLEKGKAPAAAGGVLPLQIQIPRLEAVALAIGNEVQTESKPKKEIVMPAPAKGKAMAIGALPSTPKKAEEEKKPRISAADAVNAAPAISRAQTQFTPAEKKAFERAELKTQEQAVKLEEEARTGGKTKISMVVIGHVDAGKSTITGHLLYKLGYVSKRLMHKYEKESREAGKSSFAYAWVMDADEEERSRGVTMDVGTSHFETETKHVTLLDAPGHRDFIPKMIAGAAQADVAVLVVPAVTGEFEAAFENSGQTKEHTLLVRSLGVAQMVVAVNKMDMVNWDKERFDNIVQSLSTFLQGAGFRPKNLRFVPLSGMTGANLEKTGGVEECSWYSGPSLVEAIDTFAPPQRQISKPFRMTVSDVSKSMSLGQTISGRVYAGAAAVGDSQDGKSCTLARAGDTIEMGVTGIDPSALTGGAAGEGNVRDDHMHNVDEPVNITRLVSMLSKTGEVEKKKPRCITRERSAVVQITCHRKICLEEFANYRQLGRFTLRDRGKTLAAGIITQIIA